MQRVEVLCSGCKSLEVAGGGHHLAFGYQTCHGEFSQCNLHITDYFVWN